MKPKLLITLGCSWTEGIGIYKTKLNPIPDPITNKIMYSIDINKIHELGWPNRVGKKLGFDKVINLGEGKGSHSSQVKKFYEYIKKQNFSDYDVLLIFLMTDPIRISIYKNGSIKSYSMTDIENLLMKSYVKELGHTTWDCILEQKFYIEALTSICLENNIDLVLTSWNKTYSNFRKLHDTTHHLFRHHNPIHPPIKKNYSYCGHPNENGYEWLSNKIVEGIQENHPKWYSGYENENIDWEWIPTQKNNLNSII